jgi:hypothetical protein
MSSWTITPFALTNGETRVPDMNFKAKYGELTISGEIISPEADPVQGATISAYLCWGFDRIGWKSVYDTRKLSKTISTDRRIAKPHRGHPTHASTAPIRGGSSSSFDAWSRSARFGEVRNDRIRDILYVVERPCRRYHGHDRGIRVFRKHDYCLANSLHRCSESFASVRNLESNRVHRCVLARDHHFREIDSLVDRILAGSPDGTRSGLVGRASHFIAC